MTKDEKLALAKSGAAVVVMESYEILAVAMQAGVPAAVLRVVSDSLEREMPDFNRALSEDGTVNGCQVFRLMAGSPLRSVRLLAANQRAIQQLT